MKTVDWLIIVFVLTGCYVAWFGFRWAGFAIAAATLTLASWRFWDKRRADEANKGESGDNLPDISNRFTDEGSDDSRSDSGSGGDASD